MRIGIDASSVLDELTGAEVHVLTAAEALASRGDEVVAFVRRSPPARWAGIDHIESVVLATDNQAVATQWLLPRAARRSGVDVLYCPAKPPPAAWRGPLLFALHDIVPWTRPETMGRGAGAWYRTFFGLALRRRWHVSTGLEASADAVVAQLHVDRSRLHVVGNALAPWLRPPAPPGTPAIDGRFVLSVCRIEPRKDLGTVLDAWALLDRRDGVRLALAGKEGWNVAPVLERARAMPGVVVLGEVADDDLARLYAHAEAFVTASREEGFGLPVLEAMAHGTPVLASAIPPHLEVTGGAATTFAPGDARGLATELGALLDDPEARARTADAGRARAEHWSAARFGERLHQALQAAIEAGR